MKISPVLIVGIALPLLFIIGLVAVTVVPSMFLKPQHDFVYSSENQYAYNSAPAYDLRGGKIIQTAHATSTVNGLPYTAPKLYRYNVQTNAVHELSLEEAQQLTLDPGPTSSDGYTVSYQNETGGPFFYGGGSAYFLKKGSAGKALTGIGDGYQAYGSFRFIGWIIN